jgi:hypothetical protein
MMLNFRHQHYLINHLNALSYKLYLRKLTKPCYSHNSISGLTQTFSRFAASRAIQRATLRNTGVRAVPVQAGTGTVG